MKRWDLCQTYKTVLNWLLEAMEGVFSEDKREEFVKQARRTETLRQKVLGRF